MVKHDKLFELMIKRKVNAIDIRAMMDLYSNLETEWMGCYSPAFISTNGIRQGGIASPVLYCLYIDELINRLESSAIGCWISQDYFEAFGYADDLTMLCPTFTAVVHGLFAHSHNK